MTVKCRDCGASVTNQFARVFGDRDDVVRSCPHCSTYRELKQGAGAGLERREVVRQ